MSYRDRSYDVKRGEEEFDEPRFRSSGRRNERGYGEDYRGYSRGYNLSREPDSRAEQDEGYRSRDARNDENYGRGNSPLGGYSPLNRWASSEAERWETNRGETNRGETNRGFYNSGPRRSHLRCRDIMTRNVTTCRSDASVTQVAQIMRDEDIGAVPVIGNDGKLEGIITDRDIIVSGLNSDKNDAELRAEDCMSTDLFTANQNDRIVDVINEMGDHKVRRVPVVDSRDRLVGIVSMADIAIETNKDMELAAALKDVSQPSSWLGRLAGLFSW
ncbi:MAG: CBS domain-containing protein [Blastocatellia bacterium]